MQRQSQNGNDSSRPRSVDPTHGLQRLGEEIAELIQAHLRDRDDLQACLSELFGIIAQGLARSAPDTSGLDSTDPVRESPHDQPQALVGHRDDIAYAYGPENPRTCRIVTVFDDIDDNCIVGFDIEGSPLEGRTGDRVALCPRNDPDDVRRILRAFRARGSETVSHRSGSGPAWRVLLEDVDIHHLPEGLCDHLVGNYVARDRAALVEEFVRTTKPSLLALLRRFPSIARDLGDVTPLLAPLAPTFGTLIQAANGQDAEVKVLVGKDSSAIATRQINLTIGAWVPIYIVSEPQNHLSDDAELPLVLIGDDLGTLLIRGYLDERCRQGHRGRTWVMAASKSNRSAPSIQRFKEDARDRAWTRLDYVDLDTVNESDGVTPSQEMLWRWFVDRSELRIIARDGESAIRIQDFVVQTLVAGSKKPRSAIESTLAERSAQQLFRIQALK